MDVTIEGKFFIQGEFRQCCIGVENGKITAIKKILKGDTHHDFPKKIILPTGVDVHVHFREPGFTHKEDFKTGSLSALFGGISCVCDMPNTSPPTISKKTAIDKITNAKKKSYVDFGVYVNINNSNINEIEEFGKNISGFKIFMGDTTNSLPFNFEKLKEVLEKTTKTGKPILFHAEDANCLIRNKQTEKNLLGHLDSHPALCEKTAIQNILHASNQKTGRIHICHLSSCEGLELLKNKPKNISCGATPHHLLFSAENILENQTQYKVNPPIRTCFDKDALFDGILKGYVDILESDHAPHTLKEKNVEFNDAPSGIPGVETMYPLFLYLAKKDKISFSRLITLICEKPSQLVNTTKGSIETGKDADFIIVDLKNEQKIAAENLHSKCDWTPFDGWPAIFPSDVFIRGEKLIDDYELQCNQGFGRFIGE